MQRIRVFLAVSATALIAADCSPEIRIAEGGVEVYNQASPGFAVAAGDTIGVRIPLENIGNADAT